MVGRRTCRRIGAGVVTGVVLVTATLASSAAAAPKPPPNPSSQQVHDAQQRKDAVAAEVGAVAARIALTQNALDRLNSAADLAEQKLALALQRQHEAKAAAVAARATVAGAVSSVAQARQQFDSYIAQTYTSGDVAGMTGALLTSPDPNALLQRSALEQYVVANQANAIDQLNRATLAKSNAEAAARLALHKQTQAADAAATAQQDVLNALDQVKAQKADLVAQLAADRAQLQSAQIALTGIRNQRAAYLAWKTQQAEIARREAERKRRLEEAQRRAAAAAAARLREQQQRQRQQQQQEQQGHNPGGTTNSGGHGSSGGGHRHGGGGTPAPSGGGWTAAKGQTAVNRAMRYLGWPYSWAAGNAYGPTYGVSEPGNAWNDSNIRGFDCSGLTLYAWAPYLSMDHFSATQYTQAGSYHPSLNNLMPGDLLFWNGGGGIISHEAMYIGNGNVIQAPQSGDIIKITNVYSVESGYVGATRPLT